MATEQKETGGLNYYVIAGLAALIIIYMVGNSIEPDVAEELDFFEATLTGAYLVAAVFAFNVARRYKGSKIFGRAYLALGIAYSAYFMGWFMWYVSQIWLKIENPYPSYPDLFYFTFFPFAIYHLRTNIHYFKRKLSKEQIFILFSIPTAVFLIYLFLGLVPLDTSKGIFNLQVLPMPEYDQEFYNQFAGGLFYMFVSTFIISYAIIGVQIFRKTVLGSAWGLLMVSFLMNATADIPYYFIELVAGFERANPTTAMWFGSMLIACYALYKHKDL